MALLGENSLVPLDRASTFCAVSAYPDPNMLGRMRMACGNASDDVSRHVEYVSDDVSRHVEYVYPTIQEIYMPCAT